MFQGVIDRLKANDELAKTIGSLTDIMREQIQQEKKNHAEEIVRLRKKRDEYIKALRHEMYHGRANAK